MDQRWHFEKVWGSQGDDVLISLHIMYLLSFPKFQPPSINIIFLENSFRFATNITSGPLLEFTCLSWCQFLVYGWILHSQKKRYFISTEIYSDNKMSFVVYVLKHAQDIFPWLFFIFDACYASLMLGALHPFFQRWYGEPFIFFIWGFQPQLSPPKWQL